MRVNPDRLPGLLDALARTQKQQDTALLQLSTGRRVNKPSDDPAAAAQVVVNHDTSSKVDSFERSVSTITGQLQTADSTLSSVVTALTRAISLGVQAGNSGTLSNSDRGAIAEELRGVRDQLVSLANVSYQGKYIFSGTEIAQPFVLDSSAPSGVRYDGNGATNSVTIGEAYQLQVNLPGSQLFAAPAADMFQAMQDLITAVTANNGVDTALNEVRTAFDFVTAQRVFYGNGLNQIGAQQTFLDGQKLQLASQETDIAGADMASVVSRVVNTENARNAALAAIGRVSQTTLFDYLR